LPVHQVQPIVHRVAEVLLCAAAGQRTVLRGWSDLERSVGLKTASILGLLPLLHWRVQHGVLDVAAPESAGWPELLAEQHGLTLQRNQRLLSFTRQVLALAAQRQVALMPLKGMDVLTQFYDDIGLRSTSDIDLLVRDAELEPATQLIQEAGFECTARTKRHAIFVIPNAQVVSKFGEHPDNPIKLELHTNVKSVMPLESCDLTAALWQDAQHEARPNMPSAIYPSRPSLLVYELLHAANHAMIRSIRFPSLFDMKLISERLSVAEWQSVMKLLTSSEQFWWAYVPLNLMARYFGVACLPPEVLALSRRIATPVLRRLGDSLGLSQFSVCDLRPSALRHRLAFARNVAEAGRYLRSQMLPTRAELTEWHVERTQWSASMTPAHSYLHRIRRWLDPNVSRIEM
jgi:hypothetical protein